MFFVQKKVWEVNGSTVVDEKALKKKKMWIVGDGKKTLALRKRYKIYFKGEKSLKKIGLVNIVTEIVIENIHKCGYYVAT